MKIETQNASQITNIDNLNGNFNFGGNTFNLNTELNNNKSEIIKELDSISTLLLEKGLGNANLTQSSLELKSKLNEKSEKGILKSYKEYTKELKEISESTEELGTTITKLLNIGGAIGRFITLLF